MPDQQSIQKHIKNILSAIDDLDYYTDTEIIGEDSRHLLSDIKCAKSETVRALGISVADGGLMHISELKYMYDRLKKIKSSIRVMSGTLARCETAIEKAIEECDRTADLLSNDDGDL